MLHNFITDPVTGLTMPTDDYAALVRLRRLADSNKVGETSSVAVDAAETETSNKDSVEED